MSERLEVLNGRTRTQQQIFFFHANLYATPEPQGIFLRPWTALLSQAARFGACYAPQDPNLNMHMLVAAMQMKVNKVAPSSLNQQKNPQAWAFLSLTFKRSIES
jgi:hypothetical protein